MTQIGFYHLTRTSVTEALPQLLSRTLASGQKAAVWCTSKALLDDVDKALWKVSDPTWLPHGSKGVLLPERQPIWLTTEEDTPNNAPFLFLLESRACENCAQFERVFDLFDGHDEQAVAAARTRWSSLKTAGHELAYWRQEDKGWKRAR
ncbi:DNA polymerase III subunit chi [Acetobacter tropicalis]|uniref:DNA polymerase III chi subunit n=1 Tax=Acetobacter tropicalis TaxID=104102 RepID=A0A094YRJ0_9PROT|nr:DNA polymerase III subunit chi [Acetobacter tropicalis]KAA8388626.1 DNA polymerase III subunit chi [Acetobacter tropicalis]KAA8391184.1 DNA polymerase III subunit chi [Acetobacter tropicalis]KGB24032.1 DNA polymerase III chi subunit [Acetobacter tropicalis]MBC9009286.1 DNA polymerase III subunit chi [Acetobacter tropicalis]MDO8170672.1 DNA polymerase III subunit chi [Acetobacter tropicalis]